MKHSVEIERIAVIEVWPNQKQHSLPDVYSLKIDLVALRFESKAKAEKARKAVEKALAQ